MNMHGMSQTGVGPGIVGMPGGVGVSPGMMQQTSPQQMGNVMAVQNAQQQQQQQQQQQGPPPPEKLDNISRAKSLVPPLRESLLMSIKTAAQLLHHNNITDIGTAKGVDNGSTTPARFDKHLEEFYSICDQIESHLKTSIQCMQQNTSAHSYLPIPLNLTRVEPLPQTEPNQLSYPQYLTTVRTQIAYAKDIHDTLICAAQNISPSE